MGTVVVGVSAFSALMFAGLAVWLWFRVRPGQGDAIRFAVGVTAVTLSALAVGAASRALTKAVQRGWIEVSRPGAMVDAIQLVVSLTLLSTAIGVAAYSYRSRDRLIGVARTFDVVSKRVAPVPPSEWNLTPRQNEVLLAIIDGSVTNEELADTLFISKHTANSHVKQILHKTGVASRRDLALLAPFVSRSQQP